MVKWWKVLYSPFKGLRLSWYWGPIRYGHPYFLPRRRIRTERGYVFKPIKWFGVDYNGLGWKTKFGEFRYEWSPAVSLVLFGRQLYVAVIPNLGTDRVVAVDCYWEAWLYWHFRSTRGLPWRQRLTQVREQYSAKWTTNGVVFDYYKVILKKRYQ
jgi:hypothetical protein